MFILKKLYFTKKIYPEFYESIDAARKQDSAIVMMDVDNDVLIMMVIINLQVVVFKKRIDSPMTIERFQFDEQINEPTNDLYNLIITSKTRASKIKNHGFIEAFGEMIGRVKILYKIHSEQQHNIWNEVFSLDPDFFLSNGNINLPIGSDNKWID
jgi:hypothetical protein